MITPFVTEIGACDTTSGIGNPTCLRVHGKGSIRGLWESDISAHAWCAENHDDDYKNDAKLLSMMMMMIIMMMSRCMMMKNDDADNDDDGCQVYMTMKMTKTAVRTAFTFASIEDTRQSKRQTNVQRLYDNDDDENGGKKSSNL